MARYLRAEFGVGLAAVTLAVAGYLLDSAALEFFAVLVTVSGFTLVVARALSQ